jgi:H+/Cl- antiporter ClcA
MLGYGWGMAHMHVPEKPQIIIFSIAYGFLFLAQRDEKKNLQRDAIQMGVVISLCVLDAIWATLIVSKINQLHKDLENANQTVKSKHYEKFSKLANWSVILGTVFCGFSIFFFRTNWRIEKFYQTWWFNHGCWKVMSLLVLMAAMYLFKPHQASKLYATATQLADEEFENDEAEQTLIPQ